MICIIVGCSYFNVIRSGSSRQFSGFDVEVDDAIIKRIWERAGEFLPTLREIPLNFSTDKQIRIGLRPYGTSSIQITYYFPAHEATLNNNMHSIIYRGSSA